MKCPITKKEILNENFFLKTDDGYMVDSNVLLEAYKEFRTHKVTLQDLKDYQMKKNKHLENLRMVCESITFLCKETGKTAIQLTEEYKFIQHTIALSKYGKYRDALSRDELNTTIIDALTKLTTNHGITKIGRVSVPKNGCTEITFMSRYYKPIFVKNEIKLDHLRKELNYIG